jgi:hypothetical protein
LIHGEAPSHLVTVNQLAAPDDLGMTADVVHHTIDCAPKGKGTKGPAWLHRQVLHYPPQMPTDWSSLALCLAEVPRRQIETRHHAQSVTATLCIILSEGLAFLSTYIFGMSNITRIYVNYISFLKQKEPAQPLKLNCLRRLKYFHPTRETIGNVP